MTWLVLLPAVAACSRSVETAIVQAGGTQHAMTLSGPAEGRTRLDAPPLVRIEAVDRRSIAAKPGAVRAQLSEVAERFEKVGEALTSALRANEDATQATENGISDVVAFLQGVGEIAEAFRPKQLVTYSFATRVGNARWFTFCVANFDGLEDEEGRWYERILRCGLWNGEDQWRLEASRSTMGELKGAVTGPRGSRLRVEEHALMGTTVGYSLWSGETPLAHGSAAYRELHYAGSEVPGAEAALIGVSALLLAPHSSPSSEP